MVKKIEDGTKPLKNPRHELFCQLYAGISSKNYFGNGTQSYLHAFGNEEKIAKLEIEVAMCESQRGKDPDTGKSYRVLAALKKLEIKKIEKIAGVQATQLLVNLSIRARTDYLLDRFLDPEISDREMGYVISQRRDLQSKVAAYLAVAKVKNRLNEKPPSDTKYEVSWEETPADTKTKKPAMKKVTITAKQPVVDFE